MTQGIVGVAGSGPGAGTQCTAHLDETIFGVIKIGVTAVIGHIARSVILIRSTGELVFGVDAGVEGVARARSDGLIRAVAPSVVGPGETAASLRCVRVGHGRETVQSVVGIVALEVL